ncbi:unnamed protein product [Effrenium voratum]|uniref:Uncharacterized protein n=1 Tax=Effrenium voratum TaxID=2562239 RepID=A0AA36NLQ1_9DINO|nr:unnamed protein product [Effrenium voratum]CAJ1447175.1 unnamed protein product [Effrenium voratum]
MSERGRGRRDGSWTWGVVAKTAAGKGQHRGRGRGSGGSHWGHDTRHVLKADALKPRRGAGWGKGKEKGEKGKGKGKGHKGKEWRRKAVVRVDADAIGRHCEVRAAHGSSIQAMVMTEQGIYTVSQDKTMKRWKPTRNGSVFELVPEVSVPLPDSGHSLLFSNGWLFCGLWDGQIQAFAQDGTQSVLKGHSKRVTTLLVHQGVLMTGSADKELRLWQMDSAAKTFNCTHTIEESLPGPINKIHVLGGHLFVGGHYGLAMLDLASLKVTKLLPPTKSVTDILEFQGHVIVAYSEGVIRIFDAEGNLKTESKALDAGPILKLAGLDSGPRVLCGHAHGQVSTIQLPSFEFKTEFQALPGHKVDSLLCAGHDGIFLIGSQDGSLQLWQRVEGGLPG